MLKTNTTKLFKGGRVYNISWNVIIVMPLETRWWGMLRSEIVLLHDNAHRNTVQCTYIETIEILMRYFWSSNLYSRSYTQWLPSLLILQELVCILTIPGNGRVEQFSAKLAEIPDYGILYGRFERACFTILHMFGMKCIGN